MLRAELAIFNKAYHLRSSLVPYKCHLQFLSNIKRSFYLEIIGHSCESPTTNHMVLPLVDVLEAEELALAAFQLADLAEGKTIIPFS